MAASHIFKVLFVNQGKVYEIYARKVGHGSLFGFIEVEELVFGERSTVVVDPAEEKIKGRIQRSKAHLPAPAFGVAHRRGEEAGGQQDRGSGGLERGSIPGVPIYTPGGDSNARK